MKTSSFEDLIVWQQAHAFVLHVYTTTACFPKEELFCLTSQLRRAAVSVAANIAEGYRKISVKDKLRFYNISEGSLDECRYYLILSRDLRYIDSLKYKEMYDAIVSVSKLLTAYSKGIKNNTSNSEKVAGSF
jgi:four helix bundle protein